MGEKKIRVTVLLSSEDVRSLEDMSKETDRSLSSLVREAVKEWLKGGKHDG